MRWKALVVPAGLVVALGCSDSKGIVGVPGDVVVAEVQVTPGSAQLFVGGDLQLTAEARDRSGRAVRRATVYWSTSDTLLATVARDGRVTGLAEGTVTISARCNGITGAAVITIGLDPARPIAGLRIVPADSFTMLVGGAFQLTATPFDAGGQRVRGADVTWSSSDPAVALVSRSGRVSAIREGSATITAASHGVEGLVRITVALPPPPPWAGPGTPFDAFRLHWTLTPVVSPSLYYDVWGSSPSDVFAVGTTVLWDCCATIAHYDGSSWHRMAMPVVNAELLGVWGTAGNDVYAVGGAHILHYDGTVWEEMPGAGGVALADVWGSSRDDVFAVGFPGVVLHYDGRGWSRMSLPMTGDWLPGGWLTAVWGSSASNVFAVGGGAILHYDGTTWTRMAAPSVTGLQDVMGSSGSDVFAVSMSGAILHYDGVAWSAMQSPTSQELLGVWVNAPDDVYAIGSNSLWPACCSDLLHYDGSSWSVVKTSTGHALFGIWGTADAVFVASTGGVLTGRP